MKWSERIVSGFYLLVVMWVYAYHGIQAATLVMSAGGFFGLMAVLEELRAEVGGLKTFIEEREPKP